MGVNNDEGDVDNIASLADALSSMAKLVPPPSDDEPGGDDDE
jgi:hypothetical protein